MGKTSKREIKFLSINKKIKTTKKNGRKCVTVRGEKPFISI